MGLLGLIGRGRPARPDRPDRLVGDGDRIQRYIGPQDLVDLAVENRLGSVGLPLVQLLTYTVDDPQARAQGGEHLLVQEFARLAEDVPALAVSDNHRAAAHVLEHEGGDLAGERTLGLAVAVLGPELDRPGKHLSQRLQIHERGEDGQVDRRIGRQASRNVLDQRSGLGEAQVHLPVARHVFSSHPHLHWSQSTSDARGYEPSTLSRRQCRRADSMALCTPGSLWCPLRSPKK